MWQKLISDQKLFKYYQQYIAYVNEKLNCYTFVQLRMSENDSVGELKNIPIAIKDNIAVKGLPLTCGSELLRQFVSPFDATVVEHLKQAGACIVGKTNLDEFGMGSTTTHSIHGATLNPWDLQRTVGGSSGGSAAAVASGTVPLALGSDTGGSVRLPASFCGIYGLKPSYGSFSRYGLVSFASSFDVVGILADNTELLRTAFKILCRPDPYDQSSRSFPEQQKAVSRRVGVIALHNMVSREVELSYQRSCEYMRARNIELVEITPQTMQYVAPVYHIISTAEASANLARFDGIRYGLRAEDEYDTKDMISETRSRGFADEVKMRILLGTYVLRSGLADRYYHNAQKMRKVIQREWKNIFTQVDAFLLPVYPTLAFVPEELEDQVRQKSADIYTAIANLTGMPALAYPVESDMHIPMGVQLMGDLSSEERLIDTVRYLQTEKTIQRAPAFSGVHEWIKNKSSTQ